jgi:hypothetical protein
VIFRAIYIMGLKWGCAKIEHMLTKLAYNLLDGVLKAGILDTKKGHQPADFGGSWLMARQNIPDG